MGEISPKRQSTPMRGNRKTPVWVICRRHSGRAGRVSGVAQAPPEAQGFHRLRSVPVAEDRGAGDGDDGDLGPEPEPGERRLNIHLDPGDIGGVYANFANVSFSRYEFTLTFARIEHEVEEGDVPGVVVARINASPRFVEELIAALQDTISKFQTSAGIRNLPEAPDH